MIRTKAALAVAACLAGVVSGSIAGAQADTGSTGSTGTTGATAATITVNGAATVTIDSGAPSATMQASYLTALGSALTDAHAKASALTAQVGDTLGAVQNITEQSNDTGCSGVMFAAGTARGAPTPAVAPGTSKKNKPHTSKPKAATLELPAVIRAADATISTCTLEADITVTYAMAPA